MKIISLITNNKQGADTFIVGSKPIKEEAVLEDSAVVSDIKFWETNVTYAKVARGPFYIVEFEKSTVRRFIPAHAVVDVAVETAEKLPVKGNKELPTLSDEV